MICDGCKFMKSKQKNPNGGYTVVCSDSKLVPLHVWEDTGCSSRTPIDTKEQKPILPRTVDGKEIKIEELIKITGYKL